MCQKTAFKEKFLLESYPAHPKLRLLLGRRATLLFYSKYEHFTLANLLCPGHRGHSPM